MLIDTATYEYVYVCEKKRLIERQRYLVQPYSLYTQHRQRQRQIGYIPTYIHRYVFIYRHGGEERKGQWRGIGDHHHAYIIMHQQQHASLCRPANAALEHRPLSPRSLQSIQHHLTILTTQHPTYLSQLSTKNRKHRYNSLMNHLQIHTVTMWHRSNRPFQSPSQYHHRSLSMLLIPLT